MQFIEYHYKFEKCDIVLICQNVDTINKLDNVNEYAVSNRKMDIRLHNFEDEMVIF